MFTNLHTRTHTCTHTLTLTERHHPPPPPPGTSADLFKTMFDLMVSVKLFLGRFDMRTMQARRAARPRGAPHLDAQPPRGRDLPRSSSARRACAPALPPRPPPSTVSPLAPAPVLQAATAASMADSFNDTPAEGDGFTYEHHAHHEVGGGGVGAGAVQIRVAGRFVLASHTRIGAVRIRAMQKGAGQLVRVGSAQTRAVRMGAVRSGVLRVAAVRS
jgi:hypothetical protein